MPRLLIILGSVLILLGFSAIPIILSANQNNFVGGIVEDVYCEEGETLMTLTSTINTLEDSIRYYCTTGDNELRDISWQIVLALFVIVLIPGAIGGIMLTIGILQLVQKHRTPEKFAFD